ncbi:MAG: AAA family ATPase [Candidatus Woesearchaeota archaeon]
MISSGNNDLDKVIGGYGKELTIIYGPGASGKTTLSLVAAIGQLDKNKKVVFIDTENGFSVDRFMQICESNYLNYLDKLLLLKVYSFEDQCKRVDQLINYVNIDLVIIDSLGKHYRKEIRDNPVETNKKMDRQLRILTELTRRGISVLVTNQVSTNLETGEIKIVGGDMVKKWGRKLIELKKEPRKISLKKPEEKEGLFEIIDRGIKVL